MEGTTDDTGTKLPTNDFTQDRDSMEDIGNQLVNIEHMQQVIKQQIQKLHINEDEETELELRSLVPSMDGLQSSLRKAFDVHARRLIRNLHILHLPDELLMKISEEAQASFIASSAGCWSPPPGPRTIQSLRLTCRRFCNASSHLLLETLNVSLTYSSLEHLDEVSRHPAISKGIRSLRINAALCSPAPASSLQDFIHQTFCLLLYDNRNSIDEMQRYLGSRSCSWGPRSSCVEAYPILCEHIRDLQIRNEVLLSCTGYLRRGAFDQDRDQHMAMLCQVFRQCSQRYDDQTALLQGNTFARRVTEAAARLPKSIELHITDSQGCEPLPLPTEVHIPVYDSVRGNLLSPSSHWGEWAPAMASILPEKPTKLLYQLPVAFFQAGVPLARLSISLTSVKGHDLGLSEAEAEDLVIAARNLEALEIECHFTAQDLQSKFPSDSQVRSSRFASLLLSSTSLKSLYLRFTGWKLSEPSMDLSAGPLLALLQWASLERIVLVYIYIHGDELRELLEKLSPGTYIRLDHVHLMTGLWADLLDVIREKADCDSSVINAKGSRGGCLDFAVDDDYDSSPILANQYIRGQISQNPLRSPPEQDNTAHDDTSQDQMQGWNGGNDYGLA